MKLGPPYKQVIMIFTQNRCCLFRCVVDSLPKNSTTMIQQHIYDILPQSSRDFDPEAHPEIKIPPDGSEISIWRNFRKYCISNRSKIISQRLIYHEISVNDLESPTIDQERNFNNPAKTFWSSR